MVVDIYIKSFNRPYYLERSIRSIYKFVSGEFRIIVLDDGTPDVYLEKIMHEFPAVIVHRSDLHQQKVHSLEKHIRQNKDFEVFPLPVEFWKRHISQGSDIFLLLEDDIWITSNIDLQEYVRVMLSNTIVTIKIAWFGNQWIIRGQHVSVSATVDIIHPKFPFTNSFIAVNLLENTYKICSVLRRVGLINNHTMLPYYALYSVASAFYRKDYWLYIWQDADRGVNEIKQLVNALLWKKENNLDNVAKSVHEITATSFITSTSNRFSDVNFDMVLFNHYLNEAWSAGLLDSMYNYPQDFELGYLKYFLSKANDPKCTYHQWETWIQKFKGLYNDLGCETY